MHRYVEVKVRARRPRRPQSKQEISRLRHIRIYGAGPQTVSVEHRKNDHEVEREQQFDNFDDVMSHLHENLSPHFEPDDDIEGEAK